MYLSNNVRTNMCTDLLCSSIMWHMIDKNNVIIMTRIENL